LSQLPEMTKADFQIQAPKSWVKQQLTSFVTAFPPPSQQHSQQDPAAIANDRLQQLENQNLLISSGNNYKARIQYTDGRLLINGKVPQPFHQKNNQQNNLDTDHQNQVPQQDNGINAQ